MKTILKLKNIRKEYPGVVALDDVSFTLQKGEVHILLGENGAGKSTLVKILSGAVNKTKGEIILFDEEVEIKNPKHAFQIGIGIIYQELNLIPHLTVAENIFLGREFSTNSGILDNQKIIAEAQKLLDELKVEINSKSLIKDLGIAQQQMVEVAKALSLKAKILIMDEPTSALTEKEIEELFRIIKKLKKQGVSIIYISHRLDELFQIGDTVTILRDGKFVATKLISETSHNELIKMMVNRELKDQFPRVKPEIGYELLSLEKLTTANRLSNISFTLNAGEILGIYGLLGSGRTELARAIFGVDEILSGKILINGEIVKIKSPIEAINNGIALLTEDRKTQGLILELNLQKNISLASLSQVTTYGILSENKERNLSQKYISDLNIKTTGSLQKVRNLSGGNQQKVVLSKWLSSNAKIYIFDEPTRGIDVGSKVEIYEIMNRLTKEGAAVIMISSDMPEILGMSDRILVMHQGRATAELSGEKATQESILHYALGENYAN